MSGQDASVGSDNKPVLEFTEPAKLFAWLNEHSPATLILQGMDEAMIGVVPVGKHTYGLIYRHDLILNVLQRDFEMSYGDAVVYFDRELYPLTEKYGNPLYVEPFDEEESVKDESI